MRFLKLTLFVLALLLMVELSFRVWLYGPGALHPGRMSSFTQIHDSGLLQPAADPAVYYELKPGLDTWYKGERFTTNSAGMRDAEYSREKPADTFRIAVLGSSWTMGSGVAADDIWHAQLEAWLNDNSDGRTYELLNFGIDQYGFGEMLATLETKVMQYDPDLILIGVTFFTPTVLWNDPPVAYQSWPKRNPFFDSHTLRFIDFRLNLGLLSQGHPGRDKVPGGEQFQAQLQRVSDTLEAFTRRTGIPVVLLKLGYQPAWNRDDKPRGESLLQQNPALNYIDISAAVIDAGHAPGDLRVSVWDSHPNRLGHELMAAAILAELRANGFLPTDDQVR